MEVERFTEELALLKREMIGFLTFYKDGVLTSINTRLDELRTSLVGKITHIKCLSH